MRRLNCFTFLVLQKKTNVVPYKIRRPILKNSKCQIIVVNFNEILKIVLKPEYFQVANLLNQNSSLEKELQDAYDDQQLLKVDLEARKELCDKLDIQKDKLNAELMELGGIHRKLERDNEILRKEFEKSSAENQASSESFETLLNQTRQELDDQIQQQSKLSQELLRMRKDNAQLIQQYQEESEKRKQTESLVKEYEVQNQELRHNMTDQRFREAQSREQSPGARYLADTM